MNRDAYVVLGACLVAILAGAALYFFGPHVSRDLPFPARSESATTAETEVPFAVLERGDHAAEVATRKNYAAYDEEGLKKLWDMAHGGEGNGPPAVDFEKNFVIGAFLGQEPTDGYGIRTVRIMDRGDTRSISFLLTKPASGCVTSQAITRPYELIVVPQSVNELAHEDETRTAPCAN